MEEEVDYILQDYDVSVEVPTVVSTAEDNSFEVTFDKNEFVAVGDNIYIPIVSSDEAPWLIDLIDGRVTATYQGNLDSLEQTTLSLNQTIALAQNAQSAYESSIITDANITAAIDSLRTELMGATGTVTVALATKVTPTEATALANTAISASIASGDINAKVGELNTAIANGDSANASRIGVVESTVNDPVNGVNATATGVATLNSSVGIVNGLPDGTGLLGDVEVLKKQNDGKVETFLDTYQVVDAQRDLVTTAEPYASWLAAETLGSIDVRLSHIGDAYIEYVTLVNGSKQYVASYKFIKAAVDSQSPDKTDADGFTWALITDSATQEAFTAAVNAQASADGKITTFYATRVNTPTAEGEGDIWIVSDEGNLQERWNGTAWVAIQDQAIVTNANAITSLNTELNDGTNTWASADSTLETSLNTSISNGDAVVEGKFEYGSSLTINGLTTNVGFGLVNELSSVNGSPGVGDSEFWIDAQKFKFTNSANSGQVSPFTIDASGVTPRVSFNGIVDFTSTNVEGGFPSSSTFNGGLIGTNTITADKIITTDLVAENIKADTFKVKTEGNLDTKPLIFGVTNGTGGTVTSFSFEVRVFPSDSNYFEATNNRFGKYTNNIVKLHGYSTYPNPGQVFVKIARRNSGTSAWKLQSYDGSTLMQEVILLPGSYGSPLIGSYAFIPGTVGVGDDGDLYISSFNDAITLSGSASTDTNRVVISTVSGTDSFFVDPLQYEVINL